MSDFLSHILQRHQGESIRVEPRLRACFEPDPQTAMNLPPQVPLEDDAAVPIEGSILPEAVAFLDPTAARRLPGPPSEIEGAAGRPMARRRNGDPHPNPRETGMDDISSVRENIQSPLRVQPWKMINPAEGEDTDPVPHCRAEAHTGTLSPAPIVAPAPQWRATIHSPGSPGDVERQKKGPSGTHGAAAPTLRVAPLAPNEPAAPLSALPRRQSLELETGTQAQQAPPDNAESAADPSMHRREADAMLVPPVWLDQLRSEWDHHREGRRAPRPSESTIQVTIGRVEVRAEAPSPPAARAKAKMPAVMSLEDYLRQRKGRGGP